MYKNKLTSILILADKAYNSKLFSEKSDNSKETWAISNTVIQKERQSANYPTYLIFGGRCISSKRDVPNEFIFLLVMLVLSLRRTSQILMKIFYKYMVISVVGLKHGCS